MHCHGKIEDNTERIQTASSPPIKAHLTNHNKGLIPSHRFSKSNI